MERVETLLKKINDLFASGASPAELLLVTQMLQAELQSAQTSNNPFGNIAITLPSNTVDKPIVKPVNHIEPTITKQVTDEKIVEILQVDEAEIEAELEEIKRNAENLQKISTYNKPQIIFEPETQVEQKEDKKELNDIISTNISTSINDKLKQAKIDLGETLTEAPIRDLKKAIGVNDRFLFINELFRGDEAMYERSIKTINSFSILPEAEYWIQRELKTKIGWNDKSEVVLQFDQLIKRRFS